MRYDETVWVKDRIEGKNRYKYFNFEGLIRQLNYVIKNNNEREKDKILEEMQKYVNDFRIEVERLEEVEEELNWSIRTLEESKLILFEQLDTLENQVDCLEEELDEYR